MNRLLLLTLALIFGFTTTFAQNSGGPDTYGYEWFDDTHSKGPTYNWIDITSKGTVVAGLADDNSKGPFNIGFNFQYYWTQASTFYVGANGYIAFNNDIQISSVGVEFPSIPTGDSKNNFLGPLLTDLNFDGAANPGSVVYWSNNIDTCIISYIDVPFWNMINTFSGANTFQIILNGADNSITYQYETQNGSYDPAYNGATNPVVIGIENINGTIGLQVSNILPNAPYAILFDYPDTVTFQVLDVKPGWIDNDKNGGYFEVNNAATIVSGNVANTGNVNVASSFDINTKIYISMFGIPTGAALFDEDYAVGGLNINTSLDFSYGPTFTPATSGAYHVITETLLSNDLYGANDIIETELQVIDTVGMQSVTLSWTDISFEQTMGFEGAAVFYEPPFAPYDVEQIVLSLLDLDTAIASNDYRVRIWDDDGGNGDPGTLMYDSTVVAGNVITTNASGQTQDIILPAPVNFTSGGFYVSWEILTTPQNTRILVDTTGPHSIRTYEVLSGVIAPYRTAEFEDFFIHAVVSVPPAPALAPPNADFSASTFAGCVGATINFYDHSLTATS
ncbi:MAG: hypothetical protein IIA45_07900 [Bacteroidetes bacterium]|nr:hypothetical protein [Bacteroidota bacterium]